MGATLCHLVILSFNIDTNKVAGMNMPYDYASGKLPVDKINETVKVSEMFDVTKWNKKDKIVCIYFMPGVAEPKGFVLNVIDGDERWHSNDDYAVTVVSSGEKVEQFFVIKKSDNVTTSYMVDTFADVCPEKSNEKEDKKEAEPVKPTDPIDK